MINETKDVFDFALSAASDPNNRTMLGPGDTVELPVSRIMSRGSELTIDLFPNSPVHNLTLTEAQPPPSHPIARIDLKNAHTTPYSYGSGPFARSIVCQLSVRDGKRRLVIAATVSVENNTNFELELSFIQSALDRDLLRAQSKASDIGELSMTRGETYTAASMRKFPSYRGALAGDSTPEQSRTRHRGDVSDHPEDNDVYRGLLTKRGQSSNGMDRSRNGNDREESSTNNRPDEDDDLIIASLVYIYIQRYNLCVLFI